MNTKTKILGALIVALVTLGVIWFAVLREPQTPVPLPPEPADSRRAAPQTPDTPTFFSRRSEPVATPNSAPPPADVAGTNVLLDWTNRVDEILADNSELEDKARKLLELLPRMPEAGQIETAQHIAYLLPDEDFDKFGRYLTNVQTSPAVQEIIFAEALNRPNAVKLPLLLQTARTPEHPMADEAREILELYLNEDHGTNWDKWQAEIERWLKENPD